MVSVVHALSINEPNPARFRAESLTRAVASGTLACREPACAAGSGPACGRLHGAAAGHRRASGQRRDRLLRGDDRAVRPPPPRRAAPAPPERPDLGDHRRRAGRPAGGSSPPRRSGSCAGSYTAEQARPAAAGRQREGNAHVRDRRLRRPARGHPRSCSRGCAARVPRLRLGRPGRRRHAGGCGSPRPRAGWREPARAGRARAAHRRPRASRIPAGPRTASRTTSTPTRTLDASGRVAVVHNGIIENADGCAPS